MEQIVFRKASVMNSSSSSEFCSQTHAPHSEWRSHSDACWPGRASIPQFALWLRGRPY